MIQPKVKAIYRNSWQDVTGYGVLDITDYNNDVKNYIRTIEVYRTDTGALIFSSTLKKDEYLVSRFVQDGTYTTSPYIDNLPIKAVLTIVGIDGVSYVSEDSISFVSKNLDPNYGVSSLTVKEGGFSVKDDSVYPVSGYNISDFLRYTVVLRRATSLPVSEKIEYIKEFTDNLKEIEFPYFNEYVITYKLIWVNKVTNQVYEYNNGGYVNTNQLLNGLFSPAGIYQGAAGHDPLANEDAATDLGALDPSLPPDPGSPSSDDSLKDLSMQLRSAYIAKLVNLNYKGIAVPVYDGFAPSTAPDYFVVIKSITEADDSVKGMYNTDMHVTLDIVTRFAPDYGSNIVVDSISNSINGIICTNNYSLRLNLRPDFNVMNSIRTMSRPITEQSKTYNVFRKVNIYQHVVQQL